jgi:NADPH2:quinone reductase
VPEPRPGDGEVVVRIEVAGVNFMDVYEREGKPGYGSAPPGVPGAEGAGTIADTGERVAWVNVPGSYAEAFVALRAKLVSVPDGMATDVAAATPLQGITAHYLVNDSYPVQPDDWAIVHAAAGGVGLLLTQLIKQRGGRVIATTATRTRRSSPVRRAPTRSSSTPVSPNGRRRSPVAKVPPSSSTASAGRRSRTDSPPSGRPGP